MVRHPRNDTIVVIGLGRFGTAVAAELYEMGHEVMGLDCDEAPVRAAQGHLTFAEVADGTDQAVLEELGVGEVAHAVVAIGDAVQAGILAASTLVDMGVPDVWAKVVTNQHRRILERLGVHHTVFPEAEMGARVAHRIEGRMTDWMRLSDGWVLAELNVPERYAGRTVSDCRLTEDFGVSLVCQKPPGGTYGVVTGDTVLVEGGEMLVAGDGSDMERFAEA